jgi:hypothetical protein
MARMAKTRRRRTQSTRRPVRGRGFQQIPFSATTPAEERLATAYDNLAISGTVSDRQLKALQPKIIGAKVRGGGSIFGKRFIDFGHVAGFAWPDALYVPRDQQATSRPSPPDSRLYSHEWTGGTGVATASRQTGGLFAYAAAATTDGFKYSDAAVGITYTPSHTLSLVRYEPDVYCSLAYRMFVDFWPKLVAGHVQLGASVITGAWLRSPVLSGSFELVSWNQVSVFDSFAQEAGTTGFANIRHTLQKNFVNSALATTYLVEGGRTYVFGVVARVWVKHNVTSSTGQQIPQDATKFRLYSEMVCTVPFMAVTVQNVYVP